MQPVILPLYSGAGLVAVDDRGVQELPFDLLLEAFQGFVQYLIGGEQGALGKRLTEEVFKKLFNPVVRDGLILVHVMLILKVKRLVFFQFS